MADNRDIRTVFWTRMADDGLLDPGVDLDWVIDTSSILAAAETYLLVTRMLGWDLDTYEEWLATTGIRLCAPAGGVPAGGGAPRAGGPPGGAPPPG
jgi:hypothetical protein